MKAAKIEATVRRGALTLHIRQYADQRFGFDFKPNEGYRKKIRMTTVEAAEAKANELLGKADAGKVQRMEIDPEEYQEFLRWKAARKEPALLSKLVPAFKEAKERKRVAMHTLRSLMNTLGPLAKKHPGAITDLAPAWVEKWLGEDIGPRTWNNKHAAIVALHRFARRQGLLPAELTPVERMERRLVKITVLTYNAEELERLLNAVPDEWLPVIALGAFAGLRPEEIAPDVRYSIDKPGLRWENILWDKDKINVPAEVAKDRRRRFAPLLPPLRAWLEHGKHKRGPVVPRKKVQEAREAWCEASGVKWKPDGLRHSFASYRLALTQNMAALSLEMGNSTAMIYRHYLDLKDESEARKWFAVMPKSSKHAHRETHEKHEK